MIDLINLSTLPQLRDYSSLRISGWDMTRGNSDRWTIHPGKSQILAELEGPACIKHIWMARVTIERGHENKLSYDYSSTAYYYLSKPQQGGPSLLSVQNRLPRSTEVEW